MLTKVTVVRNGPIRITAPVELVDQDGNPIEIPANKPTISLCRCNQSSRMPFCDASHKTNGFCTDRSPTTDAPVSAPTP